MNKDDEFYDLDLDKADAILLSYKRGIISRSECHVRLLCEAGIPADLVDNAIIEIEEADIRELEKWER